MCYSCLQQVQGVSETSSDIVCFKSPAYEAVSHQPPPIYDYVFVNGMEPKLPSEGSNSMELGPCPSDALGILPELGGKKVS